MNMKSIVSYAAKGWNQGWMDVDDLIWKCLHDHRWNCNQIACKNNQFCAAFLQFLSKCLMEFFTVFKFFRGNTDSLYTMVLRSFQCVSIWIIADHKGNFRIGDPAGINASRIAWRLVPPPDTRTATFSIMSLPFLLLQYVLLRMVSHLLP